MKPASPIQWSACTIRLDMKPRMASGMAIRITTSRASGWGATNAAHARAQGGDAADRRARAADARARRAAPGFRPGFDFGFDPGFDFGFGPGFGSGFGPGFGSGFGPGFGSGFGP